MSVEIKCQGCEGKEIVSAWSLCDKHYAEQACQACDEFYCECE